MTFIFGFLLVGFLLEAKKCDNFVVGGVWYHSNGTDETAVFEGCKKGCFWNQTYTDDGVKKCEKCSDIEDEETCVANGGTCRWVKGKCKSQTCPSIAKSGLTIGYARVQSQLTRIESYRDQVKLEKECIEGSPLEQNYSKVYWADYQIKANYRFYQDNCPIRGYESGDGSQDPFPWYNVDSCRNPCSRFDSEIAARKNRQVCENYFGGCLYLEPDNNPMTVPVCEDPTEAGYTDCNGLSKRYCDAFNSRSRGCTWVPDVLDGDGNVVTYGGCSGTMVPLQNFSCPGFVAGASDERNCSRLGCIYRSGNTGNRVNFNDTCEFVYNQPCTGCSQAKQCPGFVPGSSTAESTCNSLGCSFFFFTPPTPTGCGTFQTDCPSTQNYPPTEECNLNASLSLYTNAEPTIKPCDDRINPSATGNNPPKECRLLIDIAKQKCVFDYDELKSEELFISDDGIGDRRPGTKHEKCLQEQKLAKDPFKLVSNGSGGTVEVNLTTADRINIFGYATPEEYCDHQREVALETCEYRYNTSMNACHNYVTAAAKANPQGNTHINSKASRAACHNVYGCMYSRSNERCSVWAVWAFILTVVVTALVVIALIGVLAFVLIPIIKRSSA